VSRYVDALESRLAALGATAPFYVMQSNGGVMTSASAKERPVYMVESGRIVNTNALQRRPPRPWAPSP
jgi:N-methylhydantoinase A